MIRKSVINGAERFHGHRCFGLIVGVTVSHHALNLLSAHRSVEEGIVVIAENNSCAVDGIQCVAGATLGRGNLIIRDYGKHAYTFMSREPEKKIRIVLKRDALKGLSETEDKIEKILKSRPEDIFSVQNSGLEIPSRAKIVKAVKCFKCGEYAMKTRTKNINKKVYCFPCYEKVYIGQ